MVLFTEKKDQYRYKAISTFFVLFSSFFHITYIFQGTRTLMSTTVNTVYNLRPFLFIGVILVLIFANVGKVLNPKDPFPLGLYKQYQIIFGENPEAIKTGSYTVDFFYLLFTLLINIVFMNLLISVVTDMYDQSM